MNTIEKECRDVKSYPISIYPVNKGSYLSRDWLSSEARVIAKKAHYKRWTWGIEITKHGTRLVVTCKDNKGIPFADQFQTEIL